MRKDIDFYISTYEMTKIVPIGEELNMKKEHYLLRIDQNTVIHKKMSDLEEKLIKTKSKNDMLAIDIETSSKLFELFIPIIIGMIDFYESGYISSYKLEDKRKEVFKDNVFFGPIEINNPTTIFFPVKEEELIILNDDLTCLSEIRGTIIFKKKDATLLCKSLTNAKIVNFQGEFENITGRNRCIKGFDNLLHL